MRMRFKKDERQAFTIGAAVEWRNGRHWHAGEIVGPIEDDKYGSGFQHIRVRNLSRSGGVRHGEVLNLSPTSIRLPN